MVGKRRRRSASDSSSCSGSLSSAGGVQDGLTQVRRDLDLTATTSTTEAAAAEEADDTFGSPDRTSTPASLPATPGRQYAPAASLYSVRQETSGNTVIDMDPWPTVTSSTSASTLAISIPPPAVPLVPLPQAFSLQVSRKRSSCRMLPISHRPQVSPFRILAFVLDRNRVHTGRQVVAFHSNLRRLSARVTSAQAGAYRTSFNVQGLQRLLESLLRAFGTRAPAYQVFRAGVHVDRRLRGETHRRIIDGLLDALVNEMRQACKDANGFADAVDVFMDPVLLQPT